jgi:hypothetical protein
MKGETYAVTATDGKAYRITAAAWAALLPGRREADWVYLPAWDASGEVCYLSADQIVSVYAPIRDHGMT